MGILNVTPDSFSDGGRFATADDAIAHGLRLVAQHLAPDAPDQTQTIAAHTLGSRLMAIGRADPAARSGHDHGGHIASFPPELSA